ncbi:Hypothetical predicted protein, partial [Pelobates cultripes]
MTEIVDLLRWRRREKRELPTVPANASAAVKLRGREQMGRVIVTLRGMRQNKQKIICRRKDRPIEMAPEQKEEKERGNKKNPQAK